MPFDDTFKKNQANNCLCLKSKQSTFITQTLKPADLQNHEAARRVVVLGKALSSEAQEQPTGKLHDAVPQDPSAENLT